jgi:phosphate-selective porin OprO/OprP
MRGLATAAAVLLSLAVPAGSWAQGMFYREVAKDGRIFVFAIGSEYALWEKSGETGKAISRLGYGPNGETVVFDSETAINMYNFKHDKGGEVFKEPAKPKMEVTWKDGKTTISTDKAEMQISSRIQMRFTDVFPDKTVQLAGTANKGDSKGSVRVRRAKLKFEGWIYTKELEYEVQLNWPDVNGTPPARFLEDANIDWDLSKKKTFRVRFGQFKAAYGRQQITSSGAQQFVDRASTDERYNPGREPGLALWGTLGGNTLDWRVMISNGNGRSQNENDNDTYLFTARAQWQALGNARMNQWGSGPFFTEGDLGDSAANNGPLLAIAANWANNNKFNTTTSVDNKDNQFGGDYTFKYKGFASVGEYHHRKSTPETGTKFTDKGLLFQASYAWKAPGPGGFWELAFRYADIDPSDLKSGDNRTEVGGAVNYYYNKHNFKVQADYRQLKDKAASTTSKEFRLQTQFIF